MRGRLARAAADPALVPFRAAIESAAACPRVAIYTGAGASHSWIWFADLLERIGIYDVMFADERVLAEGALSRVQVLLIGGGDTYEMARGLGEAGAREIESFVRGGGLYMGSCAGAYLVLSGVDLPPFKPFRLLEGYMLNVMADPPEPRCLEHKYLAPYGDRWVFHPVYGEVELTRGEGAQGCRCFDSGAVRSALFGGPVMEVEADAVLARYGEPAGRTAYLWDRLEARNFLTGKVAVAGARLGRGTAVASGPHLEHPLFPRSNALSAEVMLRHFGFEAELAVQGGGRSAVIDAGHTHATGIASRIKREISNARIVAFGLEKMPVSWRIGVKVWEPEKIRMFLDCAWNRLTVLESITDRERFREDLQVLTEGYCRVTSEIKSLKIRVESGEDSRADAQRLLTRLKELTASFLALNFKLRLEERSGCH